jgi:chromosome partitioning protein
VRKICVINQKGGVGKTTTTVNIAYGLAEAGKSVLVIDFDPQGNVSKCFPITESKGDMHDILVDSANPNECLHKIKENLFVITSRETLVKAELIMAGESGREHLMIRKLAGLQDFDYILIDCAPSLGLLNQNAMLYCKEAFVPVSTDYLGLEGLKKMIATVNTMNDVFEHDLKITKVIPTLYDARLKTCKESLAKIQNEFYEAATNPIRTNSKLREAPKASKTIFEYAKSSNGAKDYKQLVGHVLHDEGEFSGEKEVKVDVQEGGMVVAVF